MAISPKAVYHGTTDKAWGAKSRGKSTLYVTVDPQEAASYADEQSERDSGRPVVMEVDPAKLQESTKFVPDDGALQPAKDWLSSIDQSGSFAIDDFTNAHKKHFVQHRVKRVGPGSYKLFKSEENSVQRLRKNFAEMAESMDPRLRVYLESHPDQEGRDALTRAIYHDTLVPGVGNKKAYQDFLSRPRGGVHVSLDLNDFKHINDTLSYQHGDDAITAAGNALSEASKANRGKLFRTGGDEFRAHFETPEQAYSFLRHAQSKFGELLPVGGIHKLSFSAGLGQSPEHADDAVHQAKAAKTATFGSVRTGKVQVGHGRHFVHSNLPGAAGPVAVEASPDIPKGVERPKAPLPMPVAQ